MTDPQTTDEDLARIAHQAGAIYTPIVDIKREEVPTGKLRFVRSPYRLQQEWQVTSWVKRAHIVTAGPEKVSYEWRDVTCVEDDTDG